jgi:hypothetical protein
MEERREARVTHADREERVDAPAEVVWDCFVGTRGEELAVGVYAESVTTEGQGVGMVRTSRLPGGGTIRERIEEFDPKALVCRYRVIERGPLPFANHRGTIEVTPLGPASCMVKLAADFEPEGMSEQESIALYLDNNRAGIAKLKRMLGVT